MTTIWELPASENDAIHYFQKCGILHSQKVCPNGHDMVLYIHTSDKQWRCNFRSCLTKIAIRKRTWFEGSRITFVTAVRFIYSWSRQLTSIEWGREQLAIADKTVVEWNKCLREICASSILSREKRKIGGFNKLVAIDEGLFAERKNQTGQILPEQWMFGGFCRETNECFIVTIANRTVSTLMETIRENVEEGSTIYSDLWKSYRSGELLAAGYEDFRVNHIYNFVDSQTGAHIQNIERLWGAAKWRNKAQPGTARYQVGTHLAEFLWRRLHKKDDAFICILQDIKNFSPPQ